MLLSRVAESLYWINRYLERAENISRFVEVSEAMSLDCPPGSAEPWLPLIDASSDRESFDKRSFKSKQHNFVYSNGKRECTTNQRRHDYRNVGTN